MTDVFDKIKVVLGSALTSSPAAYIGSYHQAVAIKQQVFPALAEYVCAVLSFSSFLLRGQLNLMYTI